MPPLTHEHWRYFLVLEQDLEATTRFVEPAERNFDTYSIEFTRLLLAVCSEIEVVAKVLCQQVAPEIPVDNIEEYRQVITKAFPKFHSIVIHAPRFSATLTPWKGWDTGVNPQWWRDHQKVKHARHDNFPSANLRNCLVAAAGLFSLLLYLYKEDLVALKLEPSARVFRIERQPVRLVTGEWQLPDFPQLAG